MTTWRTGNSLISFNLDVPWHGAPAKTIARVVSVLLERLPPLAPVKRIDLSTTTDGDDAASWIGAEIAKAPAQLAERSDVWKVDVSCDVRCRDERGGTIEIAGGLGASIEVADPDAPDAPDPLHLSLSLDTDIFAARTRGDDTDNRVLAARNAPAFNELLRGIASATGGKIVSVYAESYKGQVSTDGFIVA